MGSEPAAIAASGTMATGLFMAMATATPASPRTTENMASLPTVSVVSACSKSRSKLPNFSNNWASMVGASSSGRERTLLSLSRFVLARRRGDAGENVQSVLQPRSLRLGKEHRRSAHEGGDADESQDADEQGIHA